MVSVATGVRVQLLYGCHSHPVLGFSESEAQGAHSPGNLGCCPFLTLGTLAFLSLPPPPPRTPSTVSSCLGFSRKRLFGENFSFGPITMASQSKAQMPGFLPGLGNQKYSRRKRSCLRLAAMHSWGWCGNSLPLHGPFLSPATYWSHHLRGRELTDCFPKPGRALGALVWGSSSLPLNKREKEGPFSCPFPR